MNFMKKGLLFFMISFSLIFLLFNFLSADNKNLIINPSIFENLEWRNIGPAIMGGRLTDIEGVPGNPNIIYVATASSGLWKTMDGGITWKPIFDEQDIQSIGDIAIAPLNPDLIWVGTGEDNPRNSVSFGNGVYKSTDGGKTWIHMGLEDTERISRIIIHPTNPDIVYVAAVGHVFGPNKNRGVFMTIDGGKTWKKVLYIDEYHGASDLEMNPKNPNILYAGMWYFQRKPWDFDSGSDKGGVYKSIDGGLTWKKITKGLPQKMGRIGIKVAPSNPEIVYVITEAKEGTLYRSENGGDSFKLIYKNFNIVSRGFYYTELRVDPQNEDRVYAISSRLWLSIDGGKTFKSIAQGIHVDFHTMWIDPFNPSRIWVGNDGGIAVSYNKGKTWEFINNISLGQFYQIYVDNREPFYYVCGGLQDNGTWCGPSRTREPFGILNDSWYMISFGDGFYVVSHPENPDLYLSESQGGNISLNDMRTGESRDISPYPKRNDGGPVEELKYRFNWNAPIIASPHDPKTIYFASNVVFKSTDFGHTWEVISPDLTTNDPEKQKSAGGPIYPENTTAEYHCTIISLAESPVQKGVIWVGTDDGNVQLTRDGGKTWINLIKNVKGIKPFSPVSHIEPSRTSLSTAYIAFDRHMFDDFKPYIFMTTDFGKTWKNISSNLPPKAYVHVVREDPQNPNLLYAGTEIGLYVSWNKGKSWMPLRMKNLPPAAVHDILIHARENDLILGTHGRSIWIFDDATPIQKLNSDILNQDLYLFDIRPALMFAQRRTRVFLGNKTFIGPNPPYGALIYYYLKEKPEKKIKAILQIFNEKGEKIKEIKFKPEKGLNRVVWDLTYEGYKRRREVEEERPFFIRAPRGPRVLPGIYEVKLKIGEKELSKKVKVRIDPTISWNKEELKKQLEVSLELRDMISGVNLSLKTLDNIEKQLKSLKENLKEQLGEVPKDVNEKIENNLKNIEELKKKLNREGRIRIGTGNKLLEHLRSLHRDIQTPFKAPTPYQLEFFRELKEEFKQKISEVEKLFKEEIPILNNFLKKHNLPIVIIGKSK
jgi:photosystem II stability/assembly factor-like uncharacterized protein